MRLSEGYLFASKQGSIKGTMGWSAGGDGAKAVNGGTVKFCVSVTKMVWHDASEMWISNRALPPDHLLGRFAAWIVTA